MNASVSNGPITISIDDPDHFIPNQALSMIGDAVERVLSDYVEIQANGRGFTQKSSKDNAVVFETPTDRKSCKDNSGYGDELIAGLNGQQIKLD